MTATTDQRPGKPADMRWITCHRPGIFALAIAVCSGCNTESDHIKEWRGPGYGHDWHCLTCRVTDQDGFPAPPSEHTTAYFDAARAQWLLTDDLFDAYVDLDCGYTFSAPLSPAEQDAWARDLAALNARIAEHINAHA